MGKNKPMKKVCAWCGKVMLTGPKKPVSHGCCDECYKTKVVPDFKRWEEEDEVQGEDAK